MTRYLSTASLLLYPHSVEWIPAEAVALTDQLRTIGFIGETIDQKSFYAGERFLDHIAFMGCSPNIRFAPNADSEKFTHIRLRHYKSTTALIGEHAHAPNCPQCKKAFKAWSTLKQAVAADTEWRCEHCQYCAAPWNYHWRKSAGFGHVFIEITDIYPKEAIPQTALLEVLEDFTNTQWQYCYLF